MLLSSLSYIINIYCVFLVVFAAHFCHCFHQTSPESSAQHIVRASIANPQNPQKDRANCETRGQHLRIERPCREIVSEFFCFVFFFALLSTLIIFVWTLFSIPESIGKQIEKECQGIYPLKDVYVRKVKMLREPKFDAYRLAEAHKVTGEDKGQLLAAVCCLCIFVVSKIRWLLTPRFFCSGWWRKRWPVGQRSSCWSAGRWQLNTPFSNMFIKLKAWLSQSSS